MAPKTKYQEGEKVLCYHGPVLYEAKIQKIVVKSKETLHLVHYQGWNKNWDEWVDEDRMVKHNEQGLQKQKELKTFHSRGRKKGFKGAVAKTPAPNVPEAKSTNSTSKAEKETSSRSSTPSNERQLLKHKTSTDVVEGSRRKKIKVEPVPETDEQLTPKVEVHIKLPECLKPILVDDWDMINRQKMLVQLPAEKTVNAVLDEYYQARVSKDKDCRDTALEITKGIRDYFNAMLGTQLLYKFERTQYSEVLKERKGVEMTELYGAVHLLRLFSKYYSDYSIGSMLAYTALNEKSTSVLVSHLHDFLKWMSKNTSNIFSPSDYFSAPADYHRKALM